MAKNDELKNENDTLNKQLQQYKANAQVSNVEIYNLSQRILELEHNKADLQVTTNVLQQQLKQQQTEPAK